MTDKEIKLLRVRELIVQLNDYVISTFIDINSFKMLDEKIDVLEKRLKGVPPKEIKNYYDVLELYPKDTDNEVVIWD